MWLTALEAPAVKGGVSFHVGQCLQKHGPVSWEEGPERPPLGGWGGSEGPGL